MKHKQIQIKSDTVSEAGVFAGYGSVFDVEDYYGEVVRPGAFASSIKAWGEKGKMPPILWQHSRNEVIGVWEKLEEDDHGLKMQGRLLINDVAKAKEAHALIKAGAIDGLSIGYHIEKAKWNDEEDVLDLFSLDLKETSIVTFPANEEATISEVKMTLKSALAKGELPSLSDFEKLLREAGFTKNQATAIASRGLRPLLGEPAEEVKNILSILKGA